MLKQILHLGFLALILTSSLVFAENKSKQEQAFVFASDPWPPYFIKGADDSCVCEGSGIELLNRVFDQIDGYYPEYPLTPWKRSLIDLRDGKKDGLALLIKNPEREKFMHFTKVVYEANAVVFSTYETFPKGFEWEKPEDFDGLRIGVVDGYFYGDMFQAIIDERQLNLIKLKSALQGYEMLALGRLDIFLGNKEVGEYTIKSKLPKVKFHVSKKIIDKDLLSIGVSKRSPHAHVVKLIDEVLDNMRAKGVIKAILSGHVNGGLAVN